MRSKHLGLLMGMPLALSGCPFAPRCWETATCPILEDAASDAAGSTEASVDADVPAAVTDGGSYDATAAVAASTSRPAPLASTNSVGTADGSSAPSNDGDAFVGPSDETDDSGAGDSEAEVPPPLAAGIFWRLPSSVRFEQRDYSLLAVSANGLYALMNLKPTSVINLVTVIP